MTPPSEFWKCRDWAGSRGGVLILGMLHPPQDPPTRARRRPSLKAHGGYIAMTYILCARVCLEGGGEPPEG